MNDQTTKLIESLAQKLGTTTEYLWGILIKQAPISATIDLCLLVAMIVFGIGLYKFHNWCNTEKNRGGYTETRYERSDGMLFVPMLVGGVVLVIWFFIFIGSIESIITGFFNPEYWALHEILHHIK